MSVEARAKELYQEIETQFAARDPAWQSPGPALALLLRWLCDKLATLEAEMELLRQRIRLLEREMPRTVR